jgi:hypothetical protein
MAHCAADSSIEFSHFCSETGIGISLKEGDTEGWRLIDTDDPNTMLLLGTEVDGSCLHVNGIPSTTQCLLAYLLDGTYLC